MIHKNRIADKELQYDTKGNFTHDVSGFTKYIVISSIFNAIYASQCYW